MYEPLSVQEIHQALEATVGGILHIRIVELLARPKAPSPNPKPLQGTRIQGLRFLIVSELRENLLWQQSPANSCARKLLQGARKVEFPGVFSCWLLER